MTDFREIFKTYSRLDLRLLPIPAGLKRPVLPNWPNLRFNPLELEKHVAGGGNLGFICGPTSADIVDVDLDCVEAISLAPLYLPPTDAVFGRASKNASHKLYRSPGATYEKYADPLSGQTLLELRAPGVTGGAHQSVLPPSVTDGEVREWRGSEISPAGFEAELLAVSCAWLAIAALVARYIAEDLARKPDFAFLDLLWERDRKLGRSAYTWADLPAPDEKSMVKARHTPLAVWRPKQDLVCYSSAALEVFVEAIPNNCCWEDWNRVGMAIFAASGGSLHGFAVFDEFSRRRTNGPYKYPAVVERWGNYGSGTSPPNRIGFGTLVWLSRQRRAA
jgi:hypothetical protein